MVGPTAKREMVRYAIKNHAYSVQRSCRLVNIQRSSYYYNSCSKDDSRERKRLRELAQKRRRWGYRRLMVLLAREGLEMNHKRVERLYREEGLQIRQRRKKKTYKWRGESKPEPSGPNERWSIDFMHDRLVGGKRMRTLNIVDDFTRECLWIEVNPSLTGQHVKRVLDFLVHLKGKPLAIVSDNGPEFSGHVIDQWAYENQIYWHFIQPGKPTQNAFVESFNGKFRDECLADHWFSDIHEARRVIEDWRHDYNQVRPHSALNNQTPSEFAQNFRPTPMGVDYLREVVNT